MHTDLKPGITSQFSYLVRADKTVPDLYPEFAEFQDMPRVFATGFMVGLIEGACQLAIKPYLDWPREQSVGTHVNFSHLAATPPGLTVTVECEVIAVDGRKVTFKARAHDGDRPDLRRHARACRHRHGAIQRQAREQAPRAVRDRTARSTRARCENGGPARLLAAPRRCRPFLPPASPSAA